MKELTKEQLTNLVFNRCAGNIQSNAEQIKENILKYLEGSEDNCNEIIVKFVIAYGSEMRRECCQIFAEILYEVLYSE